MALLWWAKRLNNQREGSTIMRFSLLDLLFAVICMTAGALIAEPHAIKLLPSSPKIALSFAAICGICLYLALVYPVYRGLKLFPLWLPQCPHCGQREGYHTNCEHWPCVNFQCASCNREFAVWHNGKPGIHETWEKPVLALKWPYALGRYCKMRKPDSASNSSAAKLLT